MKRKSFIMAGKRLEMATAEYVKYRYVGTEFNRWRDLSVQGEGKPGSKSAAQSHMAYQMFFDQS